jgi:excisionase family DNA binding protein
MTDWLTLDELSRYLKTPKSTLYKLCRRGVLTAHKLGKRLLFDRDEVDRHIKAIRKKGPAIQGAVHGTRKRKAS